MLEKKTDARLLNLEWHTHRKNEWNENFVFEVEKPSVQNLKTLHHSWNLKNERQETTAYEEIPRKYRLLDTSYTDCGTAKIEI